MMDAWRKPYHVVIEVENRQCKILKKFASVGLKHLKVADIRGSSKGSIKHLIELDSNQMKKIRRNFKIPMPIGKEGKSSRWFESEGCEVCNSILSHGAFLISGKSMEGHAIIYSFMVPTFEAYRGIIDELEKAGHKVNVCKIGKFKQQIGVLTEKQERIFWLALKSGFFDYPRRISMAELAAKLEISAATLSEIMRRGTRRVLEHYFKQEL